MRNLLMCLAVAASMVFKGIVPLMAGAEKQEPDPHMLSGQAAFRQTDLGFSGQWKLVGEKTRAQYLHFLEFRELVKRFQPVWPEGPGQIISSIGESDRLVLNLGSENSLLARVTGVYDYANGSKAIAAVFDGQSGYFVLSVNGSRALGVLSLPEEGRFLQIISDPVSHVHYLVEAPASELRDWTIRTELLSTDSKVSGTSCLLCFPGHNGGVTCGEDTPSLPPPTPSGRKNEGDRIRKVMQEKGIGPDDTATVRVMVVYTEDAMDWAEEHGGGLENVVSLSMAKAQLTLDNSQAGINLELAHSGMVEYAESGISQVDLYRFASVPGQPPLLEYVFGHYIPGYMDEIHAWRDEHRADLCALFTLTGTGAVAFQLNTSNGQPDYAFSRSPIRVVAQDLTHIHELGHNMGCHHNTDHPNQPGPTNWTNWPENTWSAAWRWTGNDGVIYGSVMSGQAPDDILFWTKPYFSSPLVSHLDAPTGHPELADNARTLREIKHVIAAYRSSPFSLESDSLALVALYHATGGSEWKNNDNWLSGPLHSWYGLEFGVFLRQINLAENNLVGVIPKEIGQLTTLERLFLDRNELSGEIPAELGNLDGLIQLNLSHNSLSGSLPDELEGLTSLRTLNLAANELSSVIPGWVGDLKQLQWLDLSSNAFSGSIPAELGMVPGLGGLVLSDNLLEGPIPEIIGDLAELHYLDLSYNEFGGPVPESFQNLILMRDLYLYECGLEGILPAGICHLPDLMGVQVDRNLFDLESCPAVSCLKARDILLGSGIQRNGIHLGNECPETFILTLYASPPEAATVEGAGAYPPGEIVTIRALPGHGYSFSHWEGDTLSLSAAAAQETTLQMPEKNISLTAVLTKDHTGVTGPNADILTVFPNPASGSFIARFDNSGSGRASLLLYNSWGQLVKSKDLYGGGWQEVSFSVDGFAPGLYFLRIDGGFYMQAVKVVIR